MRDSQASCRILLLLYVPFGALALPAGCGTSDTGGGSDGGLPDLSLSPPVMHHRAPPRADLAAGYDATHKRVVIFGGDDGPEVATTLHPRYHADTWTWDSSTGDWAMSAATGPGARGRAAFAVDPKKQRLVVALGRYRGATASNGTPYTLLGDTWAFDFAKDAWTELMPTGTPPGRSAPSAAWDAAGDRMVMFGGNLGADFDPFNGFRPTAESWQLKADAWSKVATKGPTPPARYLAASALDDKRNRLIVVGGCCDNMGGFLSDAWALDLASDTWAQLGGNGDGPTNRLGAMAAYDRAGDRVIVFGGHDDGSLGNVNDTWALSLDGTPAWHAVSMGDAEDNAVLGCGGNKTEQPFNFTIPDAMSPERRERAAMLPIGDGLLLVGGEGDCAQLDDTWTFAGGAWTKRIAAMQGESCRRRNEQCACLCN